MNETVDPFLQYDYPAFVEIIKQLLTLSTGVLVLSVTFADKVINLATATKRQKRVLAFAWLLLIASVIGSFLSLVCAWDTVHNLNAGSAVEHPGWGVTQGFLIGSWILFIGGLAVICVLAAAALLKEQ